MQTLRQLVLLTFSVLSAILGWKTETEYLDIEFHAFFKHINRVSFNKIKEH